MSKIGFVILIVMLVAQSLFGCSSGAYLYQQSVEPKPLVVPKDLDSDRIQDLLVIPDIKSYRSNDNRALKQLLKPTALLELTAKNQIRIQSLGKRSWLIVAQSPSQFWSKVRAFLTFHNMEIDFEAPDKGELQTLWIQAKNRTNSNIPASIANVLFAAGVDSKGYNQLQFRVEQAVRQDYSEIHLRHVYSPQKQASKSSLSWQPRSDSHEVEVALLKALADYVIAAPSRDGSISLMAQRIDAEPKADIYWTDLGQPKMKLNLDRERVVATLNQSLKNAKITVLDKSTEKDEMLFFRVEFNKETLMREQSGFWANLLSSKNQIPAIINLNLVEQNQGYHLSVNDDQNNPVLPVIAERILLMIREFAS